MASDCRSRICDAMDHFTPVSALVGGLMIGLATLTYLVLTGRYAGLSGILRSVAFGDPDRSMDALFAVGLVFGGVLWFGILGHGATAPSAPHTLVLIAFGGLFVGFGTAMGNGCTSGHGVCGLGRLSVRSLAAVVTFIATGVITVFAIRQFTGHA